ncbi:MAG TPA: alginate lyase family protein [Candidatus Methylacidiphilales bacterium]|nr:alginate lyase family protein [Candidatus Methylacidiphilales bacterium]
MSFSKPFLPILACFLFGLAVVQPLAARAEETLYDAAQGSLGATARGSASAFNRDWPAARALNARKGGTIFSPFEGATIDIRLVMPMEIKAVEITGLDYGNTRQVNGVDIYIDGNKVRHADLPDAPGKPTRIEVAGTGQYVRLVATGGHPNRIDKTGKKGPDWGGFAKISVLSPVNLAEKLKHVDNYLVNTSQDYIAPSTQSKTTPQIQVIGQPRNATGHPRTMWDKEDVAHFRAMLKTSPELAKQYAALKKSMDELLAKTVEVPQPVKGDDGQWTHLPEKSVGRIHNELSLQISNLGTIYALSGEEKYADYAKRILLAYADVFDKYAPGNRPGFKHDAGRLFDQRLSDATWLIPVSRGYDLIHSSPGITADERASIQDNLLKASARFIMANRSVMSANTNWSAICTTSVLIAGYATDDQELINTAMYGLKGTKEKPTGGVMLHFSEKSINPDGLWSEGAIGYQFMAMQALTADAEILWRNGTDMYRYRDGAMKKLFDSPIAYSFPDLKTPSVHDSGSVDIVGRESYLYEYGYQRYRDPRYLLILNNPNVSTRLDTRFQQFPISVLYDRQRNEEVPPIEWMSENFNDVGFGILRTTSANGTTSLLLDYGPDRSHGHPDKMNIDLWTSKTGRLIPDPGIVWYEQPLYKGWYYNSVAHNTLVVDEQNQINSDGSLLVYGFADTMGMQRANALQAAPGVTMDRAVFLTPEYVADIFGAFARLPRKMDLAWHVRGKFSSDLPLQPATMPDPREPGYSELINITSATTSKPWSASFEINDVPVRLVAAPSALETEVITGDGWYGRERPRTILQRRMTNQTLYGNAVDLSFSKEGFVKATILEGSLEAGYSALTVQTTRGNDVCFASYRPGTYKATGLETDALQAFARRDGSQVTVLFIGGGRSLRVDDARISLSNPGLVSLEKMDTGAYILSNLSLARNEITLDFAPVKGMDIYNVDGQGKRIGTPVKATATIGMEPGQKLEFAAPGVAGVYDTRTAMLRKRQAEQEAALKVELDAATVRSKARQQEAAAKPVPSATFILVQAENFKSEGEGKINVVENKMGHLGKSLSGWNSEGQFLEWEVAAPAEGFYNISLCYCTEPNNSTREIRINGEVQEPYAPFVLPATGGYSNGNDDWRLFTALDPVTQKALLIKLKEGKNTLRLTNANGLASNIDYLVISSPDIEPTRDKAAEAAADNSGQKH